MIYRQHFTPQCYELVHDAPASITAIGHAGVLIVDMIAGKLCDLRSVSMLTASTSVSDTGSPSWQTRSAR